MIIQRGTRVKYIGTDPLEPLKTGAVGTVLRAHDVMGDCVAVAWDNFDEGHHCDGLLPFSGPASGWYAMVRDIEIIQEEPDAHGLSYDLS